jgi:hypothetical protein
MARHIQAAIRKPQGYFRLNGKPWSANNVLADYAYILGFLLRGDRNFRLSTAYIEFQNVASPGDPADEIVFDFADGVEYYTGIGGSRDYLRAPLTLSEPYIQSGQELLFPKGNAIKGYATTNGIMGVNGLPFSETDNSVVCSVAIVATPDKDDPTQDLIFARWSATGAEQWAKVDGQQITAEWELPFAPEA